MWKNRHIKKKSEFLMRACGTDNMTGHICWGYALVHLFSSSYQNFVNEKKKYHKNESKEKV